LRRLKNSRDDSDEGQKLGDYILNCVHC